MIFKDKLILFAKGSSGGGGGGTGVVDYPDYMEAYHGQVLNSDAADTVTNSVVDAMNAAYGNSPYTGELAFDPADEIADIDAALAAFDTAIDVATVDIDATDDTEIGAAVVAYTDVRDDELTDVVLPRFKGGMRDVNAVMTSAFVIGEALLEAYSARDVAVYDANLRLELSKVDNNVRLELQKLYGELENKLLHYTIDGKRIAIVAQKEEMDVQLDIDNKDAVWDLETFQYGSNVLGSIGGGVVSPKSMDNKRSALGGALSGAAAGAMAGSMISPGAGTAIGAGLGALVGAFG